jgi:predicted Rossmann fold flavoprotein
MQEVKRPIDPSRAAHSSAPRVAVVGGGPAGMTAALFAARGGAKVTLFERNEKLGKKLYITGKGRCNVTNDAEREAFMKKINRNPRFLYASLAALDNQRLMAMLEEFGVPLKTERGGRVFPASDHASDVTRALESALKAADVAVRLHARVLDVWIKDDRVLGVRFEDDSCMPFNRVILATGGLSYPSTGSTGDGHRIAKALHHALIPMLPALSPIETEEEWPKQLTGLTLKNVRLTALRDGKKIFAEEGELLFTHFGVSGPLALSLSSVLPEQPRGVKLSLDLKFALDEQTLDGRLLREFAAAPNKQLSSVVDRLAPHALGLAILRQAGLSPDVSANAVTQQMRKALRAAIKGMQMNVTRLRGFSEAVITRGGVSVNDISSSTLESKRVRALYFAGEMIDVDAMTGGYNLQIAFSTGALAGKSAAQPDS